MQDPGDKTGAGSIPERSGLEQMNSIEQATGRDLDGILRLQKRAFHGQALIYSDFRLPSLTQSPDDLQREFREKIIYKLELDGALIGSVRCFLQEETLHIEKLMVDPLLQNRGIGTGIMQQLEALYSPVVKRFRLSTGHKSSRNLHLYNKLGYRETGREPLNAGCTLVHLEKAADGNRPEQERKP